MRQLSEALHVVGWSDRVAALFHPLHEQGLTPARVIEVERGRCRVAAPDGERMVATHAVATGDWLGLDGDRLVEIVPRWSELGRLNPEGKRQVLAANLDLVLVVAPADRLSSARVEREMVLAWDSGARPVVVVTKLDLAEPGEVEALAVRLGAAEVVPTSSVTGEGLDRLRSLLVHPLTAAALGPSGAGKSTLINALLGEERLAVGEVRGDDRRGRHTTTSRQLIPLPSGGCLIDMPGLRSLGTDATEEAVASAFPELAELTEACKYDDCTHEVEPECAILAAEAAGTLDPARLASYRKLQRELAFERRRIDPFAKQAEVKVWKARTKAARQQYKQQARDKGQ